MLEKTLKKTIHNANELAKIWPAAKVAEFQVQLLAWYHAERRTLPWRENPSLYKTVVSEFMLQQTRVQTVLPYFEKWMELYPDFKSLAAAEDSSVLKSWEGLGYYSRARNLHKLAKKVAGLKEIPQMRTKWLAFPGVGPYISAAITSMAFGQPEAVVDGNVVRVFSRILQDGRVFNGSAEAAKEFSPIADHFLDTVHPGDYNQGVMELGATICVPRKPLCLLCPINDLCQAKGSGFPENYPRIERKKVRKVIVSRAFVVRDGSVLFHRYPPDAPRLAGLYELPKLEDVNQGDGQELIAVRRRAISNQSVEERIFRSTSATLSENQYWVPMDEVEEIPLSGPHRAWLDELMANLD
jgi:A/G-specific adenine glycosylase